MPKIDPPKDLKRQEKLEAFDRLLTIMDELRLNCPWDKKQTIESLSYLTIEETYELIDAIVENNKEEISKELGDILLHIVFYSKIGSETNDFDISDVINKVCDKLIHRHPHIYSDVEAEDEEQVKANWEAIKLKEKGNSRKTVLGGVPKSLPAMVKSIRIQEKVRAVGFDWDNADQVWGKVNEELQEFKEELDKNDQDALENEFGDLLFSLINYARFVNINPETALEKTNKKFMKRFNYLEQKALENKQELHKMTLNEMDVYWEEAKKLKL